MITKFKALLQVGLLILALILGFSLIKNILKITGSNKKITDQEVKVNELQKENKDLQNQLKVTQSPLFIEEEAHNKLGLARNGEIVVVLPDVNILKALAPKVEEKKFTLPEAIWQKWIKLIQ